MSNNTKGGIIGVLGSLFGAVEKQKDLDKSKNFGERFKKVFIGGTLNNQEIQRLENLQLTENQLNQVMNLTDNGIKAYIEWREGGINHSEALIFVKQLITGNGLKTNTNTNINCLRCKRKTKTNNQKVVTTKNNRKVLKGTCANCGIGKAKFV